MKTWGSFRVDAALRTASAFQLLHQHIIDLLRIGFASGRFHHLADKESKPSRPPAALGQNLSHRLGRRGWDLEQSIALSQILKEAGVELVDCSTGGLIPGVKILTEPRHQVPFCDRIRRDAGIATVAVGMITTPEQADQIIRTGQVDMVLLARELLRDPY